MGENHKRDAEIRWDVPFELNWMLHVSPASVVLAITALHPPVGAGAGGCSTPWVGMLRRWTCVIFPDL